MGLDISKLGARYGPTRTSVDAPRVQAYAAATNDATTLVPPLFVVVPAWETVMAAVVDVVPPEDLPRLLHLEQDIHLHRPLAVGDDLVTETEVHGIRARRSGAELTLVVRSSSGDGERAPGVDQYATMFVRGAGGGESGGGEPPEHGFPTAGRGEPLAETTAHVDADQTWRYRDASGDTNAIHVDEDFAKQVGLPGRILHGLWTMAQVARAQTENAGGPHALKRLEVQFRGVGLPEREITVTSTVQEVSDGVAVVHTVAEQDGKAIIRNAEARLETG